MYFRFNTVTGEHFDMLFETAEKAKIFAYKFGYCFVGRTVDCQKNGYFERKSRENIKRMTETSGE